MAERPVKGRGNAASQCEHWTGGYAARFQAFSLALAAFCLRAFSLPAVEPLAAKGDCTNAPPESARSFDPKYVDASRKESFNEA
jgi:hypothetical protein